MNKPSKKKAKVPKITEAQYAEYLLSLKGEEGKSSSPKKEPLSIKES